MGKIKITPLPLGAGLKDHHIAALTNRVRDAVSKLGVVNHSQLRGVVGGAIAGYLRKHGLLLDEGGKDVD